jgi:hypothetical protein
MEGLLQARLEPAEAFTGKIFVCSRRPLGGVAGAAH